MKESNWELSSGCPWFGRMAAEWNRFPICSSGWLKTGTQRICTSTRTDWKSVPHCPWSTKLTNPEVGAPQRVGGDGYLDPGAVGTDEFLDPGVLEDDQRIYTTCFIELLPFLEEQQRFDKIINEGGIYRMSDEHAGVVEVFKCPSDPFQGSIYHALRATGSDQYDGAVGSYGWNTGTFSFPPGGPLPIQGLGASDGVIIWNKGLRTQDIKDGTSNTIMFGEHTVHEPRWQDFLSTTGISREYFPDHMDGFSWWNGSQQGSLCTKVTLVDINYFLPDVDYSTIQYLPPQGLTLYWSRIHAWGSMHPSGANFTFADGSVQFLGEEITYITLEALSTRAGREIIEEEF